VRRVRAWSCGLAAAAALWGACGAAAQVFLRDRLTPLPVEIVAVDAAGVTVSGGVSGDERRVIPWDRVARVDGPRAAEAGAFSERGTALWRGVSRLDRGDLRLARVALEPLAGADGVGGGVLQGASAAVLAEALVRLALAEGRGLGAVRPWLAWYGQTDAARAWARAERGGAGLIDASTELAPRVPPMFSRVVSPVGLRAVLGGGAWPEAGVVGALYRLAAEHEAQEPADRAVPELPEGAGVGAALVHAVVRARVADEAGRAAGREALRAMLRRSSADVGELGEEADADASGADHGERLGEWSVAWLRAGLGRSLLRETDPATRRAGVIELLHVPAGFSASQPELSAICLAEAAAALRGLGEPAAAAVLDAELKALLGDGAGRVGAGGAGGAGVTERGPAGLPPAERPRPRPSGGGPN
jgi:hypothetical protein